MRHGIASLFTLVLISSPVIAYGQTVTAMWDPSPPSDQVTSYQACIGTTSMSCNVQLASVSNAQTTHTFTPAAGVVHYVAIRAINQVGTGSYSTESSFSIPSFTQPVNQSSPVSVAITPLNMSVTDPDGSARNFTHTGLPTGLALNATTGQITGTPSAAGTYNVTIFVTDSLVTVSRSFVWTITGSSAPVTSVALTSTVASPQNTGTAITFIANSSGGVAPHQYKFLLGQGGGAPQEVRTWGAATTYTWTPPAAGTYTMVVWARSAGVTVDAAQASAQMAYVVNTPPPAPATNATLTSNVASPQNTGTAITFTANSSGGVAPYQYKFLMSQGGGAAQPVRDWSTAATYTWTPTAGTYTMVVWARSAGVTVDAAQASAQMAYVVNTPPPAPATSATLTSNVASPQNTGTAITFTAN
ncbi:MAG TPA: putative Ig domain-containing protein, partial [Vicinamibacterales bacterium]|nr:putative Ig domain-containing protein [Vicinamibacterales bacterium]